METELKNIVDALKRVAEKLGDCCTGESVLDDRDKPVDPFEKTDEKQKEQDFKVQADILAEAHFKARNKYDKKKKAPRKVVDDTGKKAVMEQAKGVGVPEPKTLTKQEKGFEITGLGTLLIGMGAGILGTITAISTFFSTIAKAKWFQWLKNTGIKAVNGYFRMITWPFRKIGGAISRAVASIRESKWFRNIKNFFKPVSDFFNRIGKAIKGGRVGQIVGNLFKPVSDWFRNLKKKITGGTGKFSFSSIGTYLKGLFMGTPKSPGIFSKIGDIFIKIKDFVMKNPAVKTAVNIGKRIGSILGKIFLPITILMGVFDGVTGFMKGYEQDGIIGGIKGAVIGVVDGLIGGLVRMVEGAAKWIAEALGLDNFAASINISGFLQPIYDAFDGLVDFVVGVFTFDTDKIWEGVKGMFGGALDLGQWIIETPINMAVNFLKDIFGFGDPDVPFDFGDWFKDTIWNPVVNFFSGIGDWFDEIWIESKRRWDVGVENVTRFFSSIGDWFSEAWDESVRRWNAGIEKIKEFFGAVGNWFSEAWDESVRRWNAGIEKIKEFFGAIGDWFSDAWDESVRRWNVGVENVKSFFSGIGDWFSQAWTDTKAKVAEVWTSITSFFSGIGDWFGKKWDEFTGYMGKIWDGVTMLFTDPGAAMKKIIPEWAQDFFGWIGDKLSALWEGIAGIFEEIANFDIGNWVKQSIKDHPGGEWLYDTIWGEEEKFAAAAKKEKKMLTGELQSNVSDTAAIDNIVSETQAAGVNAGGDTYADRTEALFDNLQSAISDSKGSSATLLKKLSASDEKKILDVAASQGLDTTDKKAVDGYWKQLAGGYEDVWGTTNTSDAADELIGSIAMTSAGLQLGAAKQEAGVNAMLRHIQDKKQVQLGGSIIPVETEDRWPPKVKTDQVITDAMIKSFQQIAQSDKQGDVLYKGAMDSIGLSKLVADEITRREKQRLDSQSVIPGESQATQIEFSDETQQQFDKNPPLSQSEFDQLSKPREESTPTKPANIAGRTRPSRPTRRTMDDFVWRSGADTPLTFNKGDLLMGIHEESAKRINTQSLPGSPSVDNKQLVDKVESLTDIMRQHSQIHQETLKTLKENGMNTPSNPSNVMGNNSNNTTINNVQQDQSITEFRNRALSRISR